MISTANVIILLIISFFILYLLYINSLNTEHETNVSTQSTVQSESELDENGFLKNELKPSYWYNYAPSEDRTKCFACDAEGKYRHPSNCIDCELKRGRPVDKLLNRVLTR